MRMVNNMIRSGKTDICPHCMQGNRFEDVHTVQGYDSNGFGIINKKRGNYSLHLCRCTICKHDIILRDDMMLYPRGSSRPPCPDEVPEHIANDYKEACLVEALSSKAAAALGRRCLQNILHEQGIKKGSLCDEIDEVMIVLPSYLSKSIDAIRNIGNFSAHPTKDKQTGMIIDVEPGEAEWTLTVLEQLFDHYYVKPTLLKKKRNALNEKLKKAGKPDMKG